MQLAGWCRHTSGTVLGVQLLMESKVPFRSVAQNVVSVVWGRRALAPILRLSVAPLTGRVGFIR